MSMSMSMSMSDVGCRMSDVGRLKRWQGSQHKAKIFEKAEFTEVIEHFEQASIALNGVSITERYRGRQSAAKTGQRNGAYKC